MSFFKPHPMPPVSPPPHTESGDPRESHRGRLHTRQTALREPLAGRTVSKPCPCAATNSTERYWGLSRTKRNAGKKSGLGWGEPLPRPGLLQPGFSLVVSRSRSTRLVCRPRISKLQLARPGHSAPPPELRLVSAWVPAPFSWKVLGNLSKVFPLAALSLHCEPAPPPAPLPGPTALPTVLGRRRFREGLGHRGQKIRQLAPPQPPGPPLAPSRPARALASQS